MKQLVLILTLFLFSIQSVAQVELDSLIEDSIMQQNNTSLEIKKSTQLADNQSTSNEEDAEADSEGANPSLIHTIKIKKVQGATASADAQNAAPHAKEAQSATQQRQPASQHEKDFIVKLQPTGRNVALKYFPPAPKKIKKSKKNKIKLAKQTTKVKESKAKKTKAKSKLAKANKENKENIKVKKVKTSRSTASLGKKAKTQSTNKKSSP